MGEPSLVNSHVGYQKRGRLGAVGPSGCKGNLEEKCALPWPC